MSGYNIWKNPSESKPQPLGRDQDSEAHVAVVQVRVCKWVCAGPCTIWTCCKYVMWTGSRAGVYVSKCETTGGPGYGRD